MYLDNGLKCQAQLLLVVGQTEPNDKHWAAWSQPRTDFSTGTCCSLCIILKTNLFVQKCPLPNSHKTFVLSQFRDYCWIQPSSIPELLEILKTKLARIVAGNTEIGVEQKFKNIKSDDDHPKVMVNIKQVNRKNTHLNMHSFIDCRA